MKINVFKSLGEFLYGIRRYILLYCAVSPNFLVNVNANGSYSILVNNVTWLTNGDTAFNANGRTFSTTDGSLQFINTWIENGYDRFGIWSSVGFLYRAGPFNVTTAVKTYTDPSLPIAIFTQTYVNGATTTSANSSEDVISKFPSFLLDTSIVDLGYLAYAGDMVGYNDLRTGRLTPNALFNTGLEGGPLVIFDNASNVIVISPMSQFMAASSSLDYTRQMNWGIMGLVDDVPAGYSIDFIVCYNNNGINQAIKDWGAYMTTLYQKSTDRRDSDLTVQYLGYWTDNGAYYYYHTENDKNYETTVFDTVDYINSLNIPFRYLQFDSWWYSKGRKGGTKTWTPESDIFPGGFKYIYEKTQLPFGCHNRYWDRDTTYAKYNGGPYNFIPDNLTGLSVPDDYKFWLDLFNQTQTWGQFILYEQDWLDTETVLNTVLQTDLFLGQRWLLQMGRAAEQYNNINIQYCMSYSRHMLQSLHIPVVTQARASRDYQPGNHQWNIGITSIFADALNVAPFKDTFWTTESQPGNPYNKTEPNTRLQALIATLSTGPVGPGDGIGFSNKELLMKCCDVNGLILKPDKPATAINDQIKRAAFGASYPGPVGEVYTTYTDISGFFFGIVVAAELSNEYFLTPASAFPNAELTTSMIFSPSNITALASFSNDAPLKLGTECSANNFCLYYTIPILQTNSGEILAILGELDKWVPMSHRRFNSIQEAPGGFDFVVQLNVQAKESVSFSYYSYTGKLNQIKTVVCDNSESSGPALNTVISLVNGTCIVN